MTSFQLASDLHIEYQNNKVDAFDYITPSADILILAGDIGSLYKIDQLTDFLESLAESFKYILYVPGNNEYYTCNGYTPLPMDVLETRLYDLQDTIKNLYIINQNSVIINDICIVGCTLWSKPECKVPPFIVRINGLNTYKYKEKYYNDLNYIKKIIKYSQEKNYKLIVVTHYVPTYKVLQNNRTKRQNFVSLYASHLDYLLDKNMVDIWIAGHIHSNFDMITDKGCRLIGNQKGKPRDNIKDYRKNYTFSL